MSDKIIEQKLKERKADYGEYKPGVIARNCIMGILEDLYRKEHGGDMPALYSGYLWDIVNKLVRLGVSPIHHDSWEDIIGYSTRILEAIDDGKDREDKSTGKNFYQDMRE